MVFSITRQTMSFQTSQSTSHPHQEARKRLRSLILSLMLRCSRGRKPHLRGTSYRWNESRRCPGRALTTMWQITSFIRILCQAVISLGKPWLLEFPNHQVIWVYFRKMRRLLPKNFRNSRSETFRITQGWTSKMSIMLIKKQNVIELLITGSKTS